jgi:hypothetical protein
MDITSELKQIISGEKTYNEVIEQFKKDLEASKPQNSKVGAIMIDASGSMSVKSFSNNSENPINKKIHIFQVLEFENLLNEIYNHGLFKKHAINKLELYYADLAPETQFNILCFSKDKHIKRTGAAGKIIDPVNKIQEFTTKFNNFLIPYISDKLQEAEVLVNKTLFLNVDESIARTVRDLMLSDELKIILDTNLNYVQLNSELGDSYIATKKPKI